MPEQRRPLDTFAAGAIARAPCTTSSRAAGADTHGIGAFAPLLAASHDLRTPLAALVGLAESLELTKPELSGLQRDTAQAIAEEARRMNAMVNNLLDMARSESGDVKLRREWQSVEEAVGSALKAVAPAQTIAPRSRWQRICRWSSSTRR